jgi:hypothetical protein
VSGRRDGFVGAICRMEIVRTIAGFTASSIFYLCALFGLGLIIGFGIIAVRYATLLVALLPDL